MAKFLDIASVAVLCLALAVVVTLSIFLGVNIYRSDLMKNNVVRKSEQERDSHGKLVRSTVTEETSNVSNVKEMFPLVETSLVFAGFAATVYQLRAGRRQQQQADDWKRAEFVTNELRLFSKDRSVVNCKRMLEAIDADYDPRLLLEISPDEGGPVKQEERPVTKQELMNGLTPDPGPFYDVNSGELLKDKVRQTPLENKIAYELDEYFTYMVNFRKLLRDGMLTPPDLHPHLNYWFKVMLASQEEASHVAQTAEQAKRIRAALHSYLKNYYPSECRFIAQVLKVRLEDTPLALPLEEGTD
jgi:hypothetical protein